MTKKESDGTSKSGDPRVIKHDDAKNQNNTMPVRVNSDPSADRLRLIEEGKDPTVRREEGV